MSTQSLAQNAYARSATAVRAPRSIEYDVFARVTHRLSQAFAERAGNFAAFAAALSENNRLWRILAVDLSDSGNSLPAELRARLFYLHEFTAAHSRKLLRGEGEIDVLVDINTAVMRGLRGQGGAG